MTLKDWLSSGWLKENRAKMTTRELWESACVKLRGHYTYYGVTDNSFGIVRFYHEAKKLLCKWLNRRGGKRCLNWEKFVLMQQRIPLPQPRIMVNLF